jgi:hypothetical protein
LLRKTRNLLQLNRNHLKSVTWLVTGHFHLKGHLYKLRLVNNLTSNRCLEFCETALLMLCYCEALAGHMYYHFMSHYHWSPFNKLVIGW